MKVSQTISALALLVVLALSSFTSFALAEDVAEPVVEDLGTEDLTVTDEPEVEVTEGDMGEANNQQVDMELIERIMSSISPTCQEELKRAFTDPEGENEMSEECKMEVQTSVMKEQGGSPQQGGPPQDNINLDELSDPTWLIVAFVLTMLAGIGAFVFYINQEISKLPQKKKKKNKKKKENWSISD